MYLYFGRKKKWLPEPSSKNKVPDSFGEGGNLQPAWLLPFGLKNSNSKSLRLYLFFFLFILLWLAPHPCKNRSHPHPSHRKLHFRSVKVISQREREKKKTFNGSRRPLTMNIFVVNLFTCLKSNQKIMSNKSIIRCCELLFMQQKGTMVVRMPHLQFTHEPCFQTSDSESKVLAWGFDCIPARSHQPNQPQCCLPLFFSLKILSTFILEKHPIQNIPQCLQISYSNCK